MAKVKAAGLAVVLAVVRLGVHADLPVHCLRHQVEGDWEFFLGPPSERRSSCGHHSPDAEDRQPPVALDVVAQTKLVRLRSPNRADTDGDGAGLWTMIYDEGFEVNVDGLSFLAFSRFDLQGHKASRVNVSHCGETQLGWYHNMERTQWGCFFARKRDLPRQQASLASFAPARPPRKADKHEPLGVEHHNSFVAALNMLQDWWTAKVHDRWVGRSLHEMNAMAGIFRPFSMSQHAKGQAELTEGPGSGKHAVSFIQRFQERRRVIAPGDHLQPAPEGDLPKAWDWRNVSGVNYLDPVLDQGDCGSCYAVSTTHMFSARHRIRQGNASFEGFSVHFPLFCSEYNQGCEGGYAFLLSRWSQDVGLVPKSCAEYTGAGRCSISCDVGALRQQWRADNHHYVGGYYGAATEHEIMRELVRDGPLVASFEPKPDLMYYGGGIYSSVPNQRFEWERVDHAVLLVGYGEERGQKYWVLQNSWGKSWGEGGFFRMVRGTDESGIESIVVGADVVEDTQPSPLLDFVRRL